MLSSGISSLQYGIFTPSVPVDQIKQAPTPSSLNSGAGDFLRLPPSEHSAQLGLNYRTHEQAGINHRKTVYEFDPQRKRNVIKVIDTETNEEIRQVPGKESEALSQQIENHHREQVDIRV